MYSTKGNNNHNNIFFCLSKINLKKIIDKITIPPFISKNKITKIDKKT